MDDKLQIFENKNFGQVRMAEIDGKPYFVGKDIAKSLGYKNTNDAILRHCKGVVKHDGFKINGIKLALITEGDMYRLITNSELPQAVKFECWVMDEVLPQIRRTGGYISVNEEMSEAEIMAKALLISKRTIEKKNELLKIKTKELEEKNRFLNQISSSSNSILVRDVAHLATKQNIKIGEKRLWNKLREWGLIQKGSTKPMQRALEQGLFEKAEFVVQRSFGVETKFTTRVTGKGQVYIIERLLKECA